MHGTITEVVQAGKAATVGMSFGPGTWWLITIIVTVVIGIIGYFLRRTMSRQDKHDDDIELIKLTYVTKDDLKIVKEDFRGATDKLQSAIEDLKDNCLTKRDYIERQTQTEARLNQIYDLLLKGGGPK